MAPRVIKGHDCEEQEVSGAQGEGKKRLAQAFSPGPWSCEGTAGPASILGATVEVTSSTSMREKLQRKKYVGERGGVQAREGDNGQIPQNRQAYINRMKANRKGLELMQMRKP